MNITQEIAQKVLQTVDAGLVKGLGKPVPGKMCVEAAVCHALGLPHGDDPPVAQSLRHLEVRLNDSSGWSSNAARAKGLRRLAVAQLGSKGALDEIEFAKRVTTLVIRTVVPRALRAAASRMGEPHKTALLEHAARCEQEPTEQNSRSASDYVACAYYAARAAEYAARSAAAFSADAAAQAANAARIAAAEASAASAVAAADYAASAVADGALAYAARARAEVHDAVDTASRAVDAARVAAAAANADGTARVADADEILSKFAEGVVQILIDLKAPGVQWLGLTETAR